MVVLNVYHVYGQGSSLGGGVQYNPTGYGAVGPIQEKSLIYVVSENKRINNNIALPVETQAFRPQKPEVFFLKTNKPTETTNSQIRYETVDFIKGAENGAVDGVANRFGGHSERFSDEPSTPDQAHIAQAIYQALQSGGIEGALRSVDQVIKTNYK